MELRRPNLAAHPGLSALVSLAMLLALLAFPLPTPARAADVVYVVPGGAGAQNGSSWADGKDLALALQDAVSGDELWVKTGTYKPTTVNPADRDATFLLKSGVAVYGGFKGDETLLSQRNWFTNVVTLSGDLLGNDSDSLLAQDGSRNENSNHVVTGATGATLDGFTITAGFAFNSTLNVYDGGGVYNVSSSPTLRNLIITGNMAQAGRGGGMFNSSSNPTLVNVSFTNNTGDNGAALYNLNSAPTLTNVLIAQNFTPHYGGGIYNYASSPTLNNVTVTGNAADYGGSGVYNQANSDPTIDNSIIWGNNYSQLENDTLSAASTPVISYSIIQGSGGSTAWIGATGTDGGNNLDSDPKFVTPVPFPLPTALGNLRLQASSPARNTGSNTLATPALPSDIVGNPRVVSGTVDRGAFELVPLVLSIVRAGPSPTSAATATFTVTFNMPVTGVDTADFKTTVSGLTGTSVSSVADEGAGAVYVVTVATGSGVGTLRLDLVDDGTIFNTDTTPVPLGAVNPGDGSFSTGEPYSVNRTVPTLNVGQPSGSLTRGGPVSYVVTFSGASSYAFDASKVTLNTTGTATGTVSVTGTGPGFLVTVSAITGDGTLGITVQEGAASNGVLGSAASAPSATFTADNTAPTVSVGAPSVSAATGGPVTYQVTFAGASNYSFDASKVTLNATGTATGTVSVTGTGPSFLVTVSAITGDGALGISVLGSAARDLAGNFSAGAAPSVTFAADNSAPTVSVSAPSAGTTKGGPVTYQVTFAGADSYAFDASKVILSATGTATGTVSVTGTGPSFTVVLSAITGDGTLAISIDAGAVGDAAGNTNHASTASATFTVAAGSSSLSRIFLPMIATEPAPRASSAGVTLPRVAGLR